MTDFHAARAALARATDERARRDARVQDLRASIARLDAQLVDARRASDAVRTTSLTSERASAEAALAKAVTDAAQGRRDVDLAHAAVLADPDPRRTAGQLEPGIPVLLLPLRLETRFVGNELWIRAYPDEVAISSFEPALTDAEIERGQAFWTNSWHASDDARLAEWQRLVRGGPVRRAAWIARATQPTNPASDPAPRFPKAASKASSWTTAPRSDVLPDQLVFTLYLGETIAHQVVGQRIPSPLHVGPDPAVAITRTPDGELVLDDASRWIVDFDRAIAIGLGVKISITGDEHQRGFDRLVVVGIRISSDASTGASLLADLVRDHRYGAGFELIPQGTPTNHTDRASAGPGTETDTDVLARELGDSQLVAATDPDSRCDGERLAIGLGLELSSLDRIRHADLRDHAEASAMNRALWPATLGYYTEQMLAGQVSPELRDQLRELLGHHVTGRGALASVIVGNQPYGVLATTALSRWKAAPDEDPRLVTVHNALSQMADTWRALAASVVRAGQSADPEKALLDVLGLQAASVSFDQRRAVGPEYVWNAATFAGADATARRNAHLNAAQQVIQALQVDLHTSRVIDLEWLRASWHVDRPLVDDKPLSEERTLDPPYIDWLRGSIDTIRTESYGAPVPDALLYVLLRQAVLLGAWDASVQVLIANGLADESMRVEPEIVHVRAAQELTRWDHLDAKIPNVTGGLSVGDFVRGPQAATTSGAANYRDQLAALEVLAPLPTARLERLLVEHLDLCSYRLDAWQLGLVANRLDRLRTSSRNGIHVGAYGWLEDLRPRSAAASGGYVHAPSPAHAVTAAILRAGYVAHSDGTARERMSVDLRSARVRRALGYIDGLREGQDLAALLGFRFERGLHDRNPSLALDQYVLALRQAFPLISGRVHEIAPGEQIDAVEARNVIDGTRLLAARPTGYPYGAAGLPPATSDVARAITAEVDALADDMDALADLVLAESVHQAAQGKHERANAVATGLARGVLPTSFEVIETPRTGLAVTHRACLLLPAASSGPSAWSASSPRSRLEPSIDRWLGRVLGSPASIRVVVKHDATTSEVRADELGLAAIDLVVEVGADPRRLAPRVRARIEHVVRTRDGVPPDTAIAIDWAARGSGWGAAVRTLFELSPLLEAVVAILRSRPAGAGDLDVETSAPGWDLDEVRDRLTGALDDLQQSIAAGGDRALAWTYASGSDDLGTVHGRATTALAAAATAPDRSAALIAAARALFVDAIGPLPRFVASNASELAHALGAPSLLAGAPPLALDEWLQGAARVRPRLAAYEDVRMLAPLLAGDVGAPTLAQLPFDANARWIGLDLAPGTPQDGGVLSLIVHATDGYTPAAPAIGLVLDDIAELVPSREQTTGIAFQQERPTSEPPQALLLVVPPDPASWQWADLQQAVVDTFELARARAVEPDALAQTAYGQILPAVLAPTSDRNTTIGATFARQP